MPKKQRSQKALQPPDIRTFPISKHNTFTHNLNTFIKMLQTHHAGLTSRQFLTEVHNFVTRYKTSHKHKDPSIEVAKRKIKICKKCDGWSGKAAMLQCTLCEDYYHEACLRKDSTSFKETGLCEECDQKKMGKFDKQAYLSELIEDSCHSCGEEREHKEAFVHCLRCSKQFHKKCYGRNVVVCVSCKCQIDQKLKLKTNIRQSTLEQFGCSSRKKESGSISLKTVPYDEYSPMEKKDESVTQPFRQKDSFCYNHQQMSKQDIQTYKESLMFAILAKNMNYTQELQPIQCSLDICNQESLDFGLDHMSREEYKIYKNYKKQPIGPFLFKFKKGMGYDVVADRDIGEKTLICEYVGEVISLRKCIELQSMSKNDSIMQLRTGCNSEETLIIRPEKFTNMARFINGINNSKPNSKPNVATVRKLARGMPTVLLYSIRPIRKGQSLLYDYNAGTASCQYDTSSFI